MMIPLGLSGGLQVMDIVEKEGTAVMTTDPGTEESDHRYDTDILDNEIWSPSSFVCSLIESL